MEKHRIVGISYDFFTETLKKNIWKNIQIDQLGKPKEGPCDEQIIEWPNGTKVKLKNIDAVAATAGPGLIVCLSVGLNFAKALSLSLKKPFIAVNHLEGHALSPKLNFDIKYPYLLF